MQPPRTHAHSLRWLHWLDIIIIIVNTVLCLSIFPALWFERQQCQRIATVYFFYQFECDHLNKVLNLDNPCVVAHIKICLVILNYIAFNFGQKPNKTVVFLLNLPLSAAIYHLKLMFETCEHCPPIKNYLSRMSSRKMDLMVQRHQNFQRSPLFPASLFLMMVWATKTTESIWRLFGI